VGTNTIAKVDKNTGKHKEAIMSDIMISIGGIKFGNNSDKISCPAPPPATIHITAPNLNLNTIDSSKGLFKVFFFPI